MAFNAFVGGIRPGGLTNDFEVKILICFLLDSLKRSSRGASSFRWGDSRDCLLMSSTKSFREQPDWSSLLSCPSR